MPLSGVQGQHLLQDAPHANEGCLNNVSGRQGCNPGMWHPPPPMCGPPREVLGATTAAAMATHHGGRAGTFTKHQLAMQQQRECWCRASACQVPHRKGCSPAGECTACQEGNSMAIMTAGGHAGRGAPTEHQVAIQNSSPSNMIFSSSFSWFSTVITSSLLTCTPLPASTARTPVAEP